MIVRVLLEIHFNMAHITTGFIGSIIVFILMMHGNVSRTIPEEAIENLNIDFECHTDNDCIEKNTYCDIRLNLCSQCLNCSIYFRTFKINIKCPKYITECNNCLDGYTEEIFFGGEIRDLCVPLDSNNILPTPAKITSNSYWQNVGVILTVVCNIFIILLLLTYFYKKAWNTNSNVVPNAFQNNVENPPPSYHSCMKLENYVTDDVQEFHLFTGEQPPRNEWRHQNAVPFRLPDNFQETNMEDENENNEEIDGAIMREFEDPELHDEETMPSTWTPYLEPEITDFENINFSNQLPSFKRIRLIEQTTDEKSYQDEDNEDYSSDISQDDEL